MRGVQEHTRVRSFGRPSGLVPDKLSAADLTVQLSIIISYLKYVDLLQYVCTLQVSKFHLWYEVSYSYSGVYGLWTAINFQ